MGEKFSAERMVEYSVTFCRDNKFYMTLAGLFAYFQDVTIAHSEAINDGLSVLAEKKMGWAVINQAVKIKRRPKYGEVLNISTWSDFCEKCMATRSYQVKDAEGNVIIDGFSRWALLDMEKRRLKNVEERVAKAYLCDIPPVLSMDDFTIDETSERILVSEDEFTVRRRDTDTNRPVNNTKYIEWAIGLLPDDIFQNYDISSCKVHYKKELRLGDTVIAKGYLTEDKSKFFAVFERPDRESCVAEFDICPYEKD